MHILHSLQVLSSIKKYYEHLGLSSGKSLISER